MLICMLENKKTTQNLSNCVFFAFFCEEMELEAKCELADAESPTITSKNRCLFMQPTTKTIEKENFVTPTAIQGGIRTNKNTAH